MVNSQSLGQEAFEAIAHQNFQELSVLVNEYDQQDRDSEVGQFSRPDPFKNIISGIAAKLRSKEEIGTDESLQVADEIVRQAEQNVKQPNIKKRICASLEMGTGDSVALLSFLLELAKSGVLVVPFDPSGTLLISAAALVVFRVGLKGFCTE